MPGGGVSRSAKPTCPSAAAKQREHHRHKRTGRRHDDDKCREQVECPGTNPVCGSVVSVNVLGYATNPSTNKKARNGENLSE